MKKFCRMMEVAFITVCMALMLSMVASAYIDPSVTTYAIQAVAGVAVAASAFGAIYWRKARKKISKKLGVKENAKKEMEDDVVETADISSDEKK